MNTTRNTPCGPITGCGCQWPGVAAYKGIRYATAGRWEYPTPVTRWEGTYQATAYGAACYQPRSFYDEAQVPEKAFYYNEFRRGEHYDYSEDCLFLNIWTPRTPARTPNCRCCSTSTAADSPAAAATKSTLTGRPGPPKGWWR